MDLPTPPPQPGQDTWRFRQDLQAPLWPRHAWSPRPVAGDHIDLAAGVRLERDFPDPEGRLDTAYADLCRFLAAGDVPVIDGAAAIRIQTRHDPQLAPEAFRAQVDGDGCRLWAADTEGIRRGIYHLEDLLQAAAAPHLPVGTIQRRPHVRRRISRCFFGPIKRPPRMRDELLDDEDYYPPAYLDRLAHEGVNGLWLTVELRDLCATRFTPDAGGDAGRRLAKLERTVAACRRYGIATYLFCIEPRSWDADRPVPEGFPELAGSPVYGGRRCFCPSSDTAQEYFGESVRQVFAAVPDLGGLINITHGERPTTCLSAVSAVGKGRIDCPRCADKAPWEILWASLSAMERGLHDAAPEAELISWLYMPQARGPAGGDLADWVYEIPAHTPPGVILQFNFETGVQQALGGRTLTGGDYWLSTPGPSPRFERVAAAAAAAGTPVSAKIQTGCSHEVATVPYVPVPSLLYRKFAGMRRLGVSHTMLCWYFGNYPGLMNKAAGELSCEPFPPTEEAFLQRLAASTWGAEVAEPVAAAWERFARAYERFPLTNLFQYYGPVHDGPVWPLHLVPQDAPLTPTWLLGSTITRQPWPPSGDRIGECLLEALSLDEAVAVTGRMCATWDEGLAILRAAAEGIADRERRLDVGVAEALGLQLRSAHHILRFYQVREAMLRGDGPERRAQLAQLEELLHAELEVDEALLTLCAADSRLGFHSEAEGYKYWPAKIRWRMGQLRAVLSQDVPAVAAAIGRGEPLFPDYTGAQPTGAVAHSASCDGSLWSASQPLAPADVPWEGCRHGDDLDVRWGACHDDASLYVLAAGPGSAGVVDSVLVKVEPRRLWPCKHLLFRPGGPPRAEQPDTVTPQSVEGRLVDNGSGWLAVVRIPRHRLGDGEGWRPLRVDVRVALRGGRVCGWQPQRPVTPRLRLGSDNPADLGWLTFGAA